MINVEMIRLALTIISGVSWTTVYIRGIQVGLRDRSYAIPFYALALNFAWELLHANLGLSSGLSAQSVINAIWFTFDIGILVTYFKFGRKYFPLYLHARGFLSWSILGLLLRYLCSMHSFVSLV
jgi:hypothetical protein